MGIGIGIGVGIDIDISGPVLLLKAFDLRKVVILRTSIGGGIW